MTVNAPAPRDAGPGVRIPPPTWYALGLLCSWLLTRLYPLPFLPRPASLTLMAVFLITSGVLAGSAIGLFRRLRTGLFPHTPATRLVTSGPYRFTRNPMYLALALLYLAAACWFAWFWAVILLPIVILTVTLRVIRFEEPYLESKFGADYRAYKQRVRRWL